MKVELDTLRLPTKARRDLVDRVDHVEEGDHCGNAKRAGDNPCDVLCMLEAVWIRMGRETK
jgi:hypothetical protein